MSFHSYLNIRSDSLYPSKKLQKCHWIEGFIIQKMLAKYKPFYEGLAKRKFHDAKEVNDYFSRKR